MIKTTDEYTKIQEMIPFVYGIEDTSIIPSTDRKTYIDYKKGLKQTFNPEELLDINILTLLENIGLPIEELGTYLYKDVIKSIINITNNSMKDSEVTELKNQLTNPYSQFYLDIARNDQDMGLTTFHCYIQATFSKKNQHKNHFYFITGNQNTGKLDYGKLAFQLASYVKITFLQEQDSQLQKNTGKKLCNKNR